MTATTHSIELTTASIYNQEWKAKNIIGYGAGIYIGSGIDAKFIAKISAVEIGHDHVYNLALRMCDEHNDALAGGVRYKAKKRPVRNFLRNIFSKKFEYNYPAGLK